MEDCFICRKHNGLEAAPPGGSTSTKMSTRLNMPRPWEVGTAWHTFHGIEAALPGLRGNDERGFCFPGNCD